jgi:uncharacterized membrane protein
LMDERIQVAIIAVLLGYAALTAAPIALGERVVEPFSELGLLGPYMKLGDYPRTVEAGEAIDLYLYLGNHEGSVQYYRVDAKVGDRMTNVSDTEPYPGTPVYRYERVLMDETNHTEPVTVSLSEPGENWRLVFELYRYDQEVRGFAYQGNWVQLWLNVTEPT